MGDAIFIADVDTRSASASAITATLDLSATGPAASSAPGGAVQVDPAFTPD